MADSLIKVSVIIPVYNRAALLAQALKSLTCQTFQQFSVTVCDDASTEDLKAVVSMFPELAIRYERFELNTGAPGNHQRGAELCDTKYALFLNDDDLMFPNAIEAMFLALEANPSAAICLGACVEFVEGPDKTAKIVKKVVPFVPSYPRKWWIPLDQLSCFNPSQTMLRMTAVKEIGGYHKECRTAHDWELYLALIACYRAIAVQEVTTGYRIHAGQLIKQSEIGSGALSARDGLFVTSSSNLLRSRIKMSRIQRIYFRQKIAWNLLLRSFRSTARHGDVSITWQLLRANQLVLPLILCFPVWLAIYLATRNWFPKSSEVPANERLRYEHELECSLQTEPSSMS